MLRIEPAEDLGVLLQRVGERDAGLDVGAHLADDLGQLLVLGLLFEHVRARSMARPALIMVASWREKMVRSCP